MNGTVLITMTMTIALAITAFIPSIRGRSLPPLPSPPQVRVQVPGEPVRHGVPEDGGVRR